MSDMTPGERVVRCLAGQPVDRAPFGVGLGWSPWGETLARWRQESGDAALNPARALGCEPGFVSPGIHAGIFPAFERQVLEETAEHTVFRNERGITVRQLKGVSNMPEWLDYPVKSREDWERLKAERLDPTAPGRLAVDWDAFRAELERSGCAVQVGSFPWGVFGTVRDFLGVEALLMGFYDEPELIRDIMNHLTTLWLELWERVAGEVRIDHIHIWEDMSGRQGSLISPAMVEAFMMPCYDRIAAFAASHDVRLVSVDTDGDCSELVPLMIRHGVNVFFPFEVQAGNDILDYRARYPGLGIMGGLDKRALALGRAAVDREADRAARMLRAGRYVPGFDHLIPPDVPWKTMVYAAERIRTLCFEVSPRPA
jgi:uroporphyrinogen decarboxylase